MLFLKIIKKIEMCHKHCVSFAMLESSENHTDWSLLCLFLSLSVVYYNHRFLLFVNYSLHAYRMKMRHLLVSSGVGINERCCGEYC